MTPSHTRPLITTRLTCLMLLSLFGLLALGCQSYQLQGSVVQGPESAIMVVGKNDQRLQLPGISGAALTFTIDPRSLNAETLSTELTDPQGQFSVSVPHTGAGFLEYELEVLARAAGYVPVARSMKLPSGNKRLLIILSPGEDRYKKLNDILGETMDMGRQLAPGQ